MLSQLMRDALAQGASRKKSASPKLLREVWPTLLGEPLCHRTQPKYLRSKTLVIAVASEAWLKEIKRHQRSVHARIHRLLPWPVDNLEFVVESLPPAPRADSSDASQATSQLPAPDSGEFGTNTQASLARLDKSTRALALRIRAHIDEENAAQKNVDKEDVDETP